jgi:predicted nucleic acid-binding protein
MKIYLDTNVLLSAINENDENHIYAKKCLDLSHTEFYTAPITLLEFSTNLGILWRNGGIEISPEFKQTLKNVEMAQQIRILNDFFWQSFKLQLVSNSSIEKFHFQSNDYLLEDTLSLAYQLFSSLPLRTLDLIQIASALKIKLYSKVLFDYFLTDDQTILKWAGNVYQKTRIFPIGCKKLLDSLN